MKRLGRGGAAEIKSHSYFKNVDFGRLEKKQIKPPFIPEMRNDDHSGFVFKPTPNYGNNIQLPDFTYEDPNLRQMIK